MSNPAPETRTVTLTLADAEVSAALARAIEPLLRTGDTILLEGPVGAGKSHIARQLIVARLARHDRHEDIPSPTFTLVQTYEAGDDEIWHADLYRLSHPDEVAELGLLDAFDRAICLIEWPDRLGADQPRDALCLSLDHATEGLGRRVQISGGARWNPVIAAITQAVARATAISAFLAAIGWGGGGRQPLAGDASTRRYLRVWNAAGDSAMLMDAPPDHCGPQTAFVRMTGWLRAHGYSAPDILGQDEAAGLLLLEDLGLRVLADDLIDDPAAEPAAYRQITHLLADLHRHAPPADLTALTAAELGRMTRIAADWYADDTPGDSNPGAHPAADALQAAMTAAAHQLTEGTPLVLALRDLHAENLIALPDRVGVRRLGLLDYQDAVRAHPAYDLASALQDARRDVSPVVEQVERDHYAALTGADPAAFAAAYALLGAQRNLRIMGVFARLCLAGGKAGYLGYLPRVWGYVQRNLAHPALADLAAVVHRHLPPPTPERLERMARQCGTFPMR